MKTSQSTSNKTKSKKHTPPAEKTMKKLIPVEQIKAHRNVQARVSLDAEVLADYTDIAKDAHGKGADFPFPDLVVFEEKNDGEGSVFHLADGFHRLKAAKTAGYTDVQCSVKDGGKRDAQEFAFKANILHGARLTNEDKIHNLNNALKDPEWQQYSSSALADLLGVSEGFVRSHRPVAASPTERKTKSGKTMKVGKIGKKKEDETSTESAAPTESTSPFEIADEEGGIEVAPPAEEAEPATKKEPKEDEDLSRACRRIKSVLGERGVATIAAVNDGSLSLTARDLKEWASTSDGRIEQVYPLVTDLRWKPRKAFSFLDKEIDADTRLDHLVNLSLCSRGKAEERIGNSDYRVIVFDTNKFEIDIVEKVLDE